MKYIKIALSTMSLSGVVWIGLIVVSLILIATDLHKRPVNPESRYYPLFFQLVLNTPHGIRYISLYALVAYQEEHEPSAYSFLVPFPPESCETLICYTVIEDHGEMQRIEVIHKPDSLFALTTYSLYQASAHEIKPISMQKISIDYFLFICLGLYLIRLLSRLVLWIMTMLGRERRPGLQE